MDISIKTGVEHYKVRDERKKVIAEFDLNPGDISAVRRLQEVDAELRRYKIPDTDNAASDIAEAERYIEGRFEYLLGYEGASKEVFKRYSPLTPLENTWFFQSILAQIEVLIGAGVAERSAKIAEQIEKAMKDLA